MAFKKLITGFVAIVSVAASARPAIAGELVVPGTGDSEKALISLASLFEKKYPGDKIVVPPSIGSGGGIKAVVDGSASLARIARPLQASEEKQGVKARVFGVSPIAFVVNGGYEHVTSLSSADIVKLYSGKVTNWKDLGGADQKLYLIAREKGDSSTLILIEQIPGFGDLKSYAGKTAYSTGEAISLLIQHKNTLGYVPYGVVAKEKLRILSVDGVEPNAESIASGRYKLVTRFAFAWKGELTGLAKKFADFISDSKEAREFMRSNGIFPGK